MLEAALYLLLVLNCIAAVWGFANRYRFIAVFNSIVVAALLASLIALYMRTSG